VWHGTEDATLSFNNFGEEIKMWTNVLGVSQTPTSTENNTPQSSWTRTRYADAAGTVQVEAVREQGQPHNLQIVADKAVQFLGLDVANTSIADGNRSVPGSGAFLRVSPEAGTNAFRIQATAPPGRLTLDVYTAGGIRIRNLTDGYGVSGTLDMLWNGELGNGSLAPEGIYLAVLKVNGMIVGHGRFAVMAR
jgi:hypothetical protein